MITSIKYYIKAFIVVFILCHARNFAYGQKQITQIQPVVCYFQGTEQTGELVMKPENQSRIKDNNGAEWMLSLKESKVAGQPDATDFLLTWTLLKGQASEVAVGVKFPFEDWSAENYVFIPAAIYNGNRFDIKNIGYPPYWYDPSEWRLDMPTTITPAPTLGKGDHHAKIELNTGNASTPLMAFHSAKKQTGWMVLTTQESHLGNHGLFVEENENRTQATFSIMTPAVRKTRATGNGFAPSGDKAPDWKQGDTVSLRFRIYTFKAPSLQHMLNRFSEVRKDLNPSKRVEVLPFSEAWALENNLYQSNRWDEKIHMYWLSDVGANTSWNFIWQLGWCGGGQCTLPFILNGTEQVKQRAIDNIEVIFTKSQAPSGFFNTYGNGVEFASFGYGSAMKHNETFVRSQGDWLYMAQRQFQALKTQDREIPGHWMNSLKKQADAFVRLWDKYGQFGQFVDVVTGDMCIGGSTAGAIVPGGLALASVTWDNPRYLEIAEQSARKYHKDYVLKGYTTGGPGEILSAPDSESAFALFESFMALYEITGSKEWLVCASDLLPICASWIVSYDYQFPERSTMGKIDARSCGSMWASVANKHSAPGLCTWSGDCLLKYFRATGNRYALELLEDVAHGLPQYISRKDRPIGNMPPGGICERVNMSDWEGKDNIGGNIFASCSWCETAVLLTVTQLPGIYVQPDKEFVAVFDNVLVEKTGSAKGKMKIRVTNPTKFVAEVKIFSESSKDAKKKTFSLLKGTTILNLAAGESKNIEVQ